MVDFKLKVLEAQNQGLLQDTAVQNEFTSYRSAVTQSYMLEKEVTQEGLKQMLQRKKEN